MSETLLEVANLRTTLEVPGGRIRPVDDVSFTLRPGRTLGIVGESGSGKSVLVRSVMGLLSQRSATRTGSIVLGGQELIGLRGNELRSLWGTTMAMVFQDPLTSLNPVMRIGSQLDETLRLRLGFGRRQARETSAELLRAVGIPDPVKRLRQYPHELSGGMRQRVCIAIALAGKPRLLLADEPTTALDVTVQEQILELLHDLRTERDLAVVLVTHDLGVVAGEADEVIVMYAGQVVERAPTAALFANVRMPYTEALLGSIPRVEQPSHTRLTAIAGRPPSFTEMIRGCRFAPRCPYAQDLCGREPPPLIQSEDPTHWYRCWYPLGEGASGRQPMSSTAGVPD